MPAEKTVAVSFRVSPRFKHLLEAAAAHQHRSQTNMLEALLFDIERPTTSKPTRESSKGGTKK